MNEIATVVVVNGNWKKEMENSGVVRVFRFFWTEDIRVRFRRR